MGRIYFFTGKGGVGKTTLCESFELFLRQQSLDKQIVRYQWPTQEEDLSHTKSSSNSHASLSFEQATIEYLALKLHSNRIAQWIYRTHFFRSILNMLPGLGYLILLGKIIYQLKLNPEMDILVDGPSSGHMLSIFHAPSNFAKMFRIGPLFDDIAYMQRVLEDKQRFELIHVQLPTAFSHQEGQETEEDLRNNYPNMQITTILNQSLTCSGDLQHSLLDASQYLKHKWEEESDVIQKQSFSVCIPLIKSNDEEVRRRELVKYLAPLIPSI